MPSRIRLPSAALGSPHISRAIFSETIATWRFLVEIGPGEIAPGDQGGARGFEESRGDELEPADGRDLPDGIGLSSAKRTSLLLRPSSGASRWQRDRCHSRNRRQLIRSWRSAFASPVRALSPAPSGIETRSSLEFVGMCESGLNVPQRLKRPDHQAGTDQQHQRQRHLHDHQSIARAMPLPALSLANARRLAAQLPSVVPHISAPESSRTAGRRTATLLA